MATMIHGQRSAGGLLIVAGRRPSFAMQPDPELPGGSRIAIGIRRAVTALQPDLMRQVPFRPGQEELRIEGKAAVRIGVELHHPAVEPALVELRVDRAVERVGEVDAPAVAADLDHLWS